MSSGYPSGQAELSKRGRKLVESPPAAEYLREHFQRSAAPHSPERPDGYIPLCIAENKLVSELLLAKMAECRDVPARALGYDAMTGSHSFRRALSGLFARTFVGRELPPENLAVLAGAGSVLELLFYAIADPGDAVLVPTPSYAGFWPDLETRDELAVVPVHTRAETGFRLGPEELEGALSSARAPVRALLFTSPDNPTGRVYSAAEVSAVIEWCARKNLHLVLDEVYALSVFGPREFVSGARLLPTLGERVHLVWAFSKDFAASGLRVGVLASENRALLAAVDALAYWAACSGDTQWLLERMISDSGWVDAFTRESRRRLAEAHARVARALDRAGLAHVGSDAGFFLLLDLRRFLTVPSFEAEALLWRRLLDVANVNLTPGSACRVSEPGFFRLCFAGVPTDVAVLGVERLARALA
ncbi:MAG: aminotransferase class I/II-fold pyridoxal phosphate-dependent enzyme [Polyangiaceae bacterium]